MPSASPEKGTIQLPQVALTDLRPGADEFPLHDRALDHLSVQLRLPELPLYGRQFRDPAVLPRSAGRVVPGRTGNKIARECGEYGAWMRCTGGGEPMLHQHMDTMIEYAKAQGARVWLNTNGSMFGPRPSMRKKLERIIRAGIDLIEFSMDAGDPETYAVVRPPRGGPPSNPQQWWERMVGNVRAALEMRKQLATLMRVVVSIIRQQAIEGKLDEAIKFWIEDVGVDDVIRANS